MPVAIMSQFFRLNLVCFGPVILGLAASHAWATGAAFDYAARLYQQAEWQQAADGFARCLQNSNTEPSKLTSTHFYLGECLVQLGHFAEARQQYEMVLQAGAGDQFAPQATFRIGEIAWLAADPSQAKSRLSQFVQKYPHNALTAYALAYLGEIALAQNDLQQAIVFYRRVVENYSHSPNANKVRVELAKTLLTVGRVDEVSVAIGRLASADDPKWASESLLIQGRAAYHGKHFETAQEDFRRLYERYPDSPLAPRARLAAGWSLWKLGKIADIEEMISPLESNPRWQEDYHYLLGLAANEVQRGSSAMKEPAKDDLASSLENALSEIGQSSGAVASTDQQPAPRLAQDDDPTREPAQFDHEDFLVDQPTPLLAQDDYPTSLEIEGVRQVNASRQAQLLDEAVGLVRDGRHDAALAAYRELLLTHSPGEVHAEALWRSARLHDRLAQRADALQLYRQLLAEYPETTHAAEARLALAWHLDRSGERVSARVEFQELHSKFPQSSQASEAAYWLAVAAADETDSSRSSHYADWLLVRLSDADKRTTPRHRELWGRTLCLKCQLVAATERWQVIRELVAQHGGEFEEGSIKKRLDLWSAEAEFRSGRYDQARMMFEQLQPRTEDVDETWVAMVPLRRAQLAARRQQWTEVLKIIDLLEGKYPSFELMYEVDYLRGRANAGRGSMAAARTAYRQVLENPATAGTETATMARWMIGETFFHQHDYARARDAFQKVMQQPAHPEWKARAALQAGKCWELEQQWEEAKALYNLALERWQDSQSQEQLQARLKWANHQLTQKR